MKHRQERGRIGNGAPFLLMNDSELRAEWLCPRKHSRISPALTMKYLPSTFRLRYQIGPQNQIESNRSIQEAEVVTEPSQHSEL
jgi:hypothetical protein